MNATITRHELDIACIDIRAYSVEEAIRVARTLRSICNVRITYQGWATVVADDDAV